MSTTLGRVKAQARQFVHTGDYARALRAYEQLLATVPLDYEVRFRIADVLVKIGLADQAALLYRSVAMHNIRTGHPLPAVVASRALEALGCSSDEVLSALATTYCSGSPQLARFAARQAPMDPGTRIDLAESDEPEELDQVVERALRRALDVSAFADFEQQFHPVPFFSELRREELLAVLRSLTVRRLSDGEVVMRQGEPGTALYLMAGGAVRVTMTDATHPAGNERELARLYENTLFGEMALITDQPRSASVAALGEADVIEVSRAALAQVTARLPTVKEVLDRFTRERLIKNVLQTSPLFTPFSKAQQSDLLRRFEGHEVEPGLPVIREGEPGPGLFVVLTGTLEVVARADSATPVRLGLLVAGDIFGEMSLVSDQPTSATVRATSRSALLFLARTYVERLAAAIPEVRDYFEQVAFARARGNTVTLTRPPAAPAAPLDVMELADDDVLLL